ncbi:glutamyl-tRNA reductase [bacterium]|jgi:glutamyl-tRNA reductase|nr:glutamyl-tRNA reductase [bacterium]
MDSIGLFEASFQQVSWENLESVCFRSQDIPSFLRQVKKSPLINECVLLSTCNRIELYFEADNLVSAKKVLLSIMSQFQSIDEEKLAQIFLFKKGQDVIRHLFEVSCGMKSMVFGENEILGQIKNAYFVANTEGTTKKYLNKVFQMGISVGKKVRSHTSISKGASSVTSIGIDAIRAKFPQYLNMSVLVVGAGTMGLRSIKKLVALGHNNITIINRTDDKLDRICSKYELQTFPFELLDKRAGDFHLIIAATGSKEYILHPRNLSSNSKTQFIVDLGMPRNVDAEVSSFVTVHTLSQLKEYAVKTLDKRQEDEVNAMKIVDEELIKLEEWKNYSYA